MVADAVRHVHAVVTGKVQGVWFRKGTQHEARRLGLSGWVRNLPDGRVELEARGPSGDVAALVAWLHEGTPAARVDHVEVMDVARAAPAGPFEVRS